MTTQETEVLDTAPNRATTRSSSKAYSKRIRRQQLHAGARLTATGSPIAATLSRVPYVALIILLLAGGVVGVLWLNTMSDAADLRASQSRLNQMDLSTQIEAAKKSIADLQDPAKLGAEARSLGLVPAGDAAIISIGPKSTTVLGSAVPVPTPGTTPASAASTTAATTAPATTAPATTTAAVTTTAAARATAPKKAAANAPTKASAGKPAAKPTTKAAVKTAPVKTVAKKAPTTHSTAAVTTGSPKAGTATSTHAPTTARTSAHSSTQPVPTTPATTAAKPTATTGANR